VAKNFTAGQDFFEFTGVVLHDFLPLAPGLVELIYELQGLFVGQGLLIVRIGHDQLSEKLAVLKQFFLILLIEQS
jgi:hypothetical protein